MSDHQQPDERARRIVAAVMRQILAVGPPGGMSLWRFVEEIRRAIKRGIESGDYEVWELESGPRSAGPRRAR